MTEQMNLSQEQQQQLTELVDQLTEKLSTANAQNETLRQENKQLNDLVEQLSVADTMLNEAETIQEQTNQREKELNEREKDITRSAASVSDERAEWDEEKKKAQAEKAEWDETKKKHYDALEKDRVKMEKTFRDRVKKRVNKEVTGFVGMFFTALGLLVLVGGVCGVYSGAADHLESFIYEIEADIDEMGVVMGLLNKIFMIWVQLILIIICSIYNFRKHCWGYRHFIVATLSFSVMVAFGKLLPVNSFLLFINAVTWIFVLFAVIHKVSHDD